MNKSNEGKPIREGLARLLAYGDPKATIGCPVKFDLAGYYGDADQIIAYLKAEIEQMENPYKHNRSLLDGYEQCRKDILGKLSEELK